MSDAFRDGLSAALQRAENLEEENELLREEIAQLRQSSQALRENVGALPTEATPETRALADKALEVLERLEVVSKRGSELAKGRAQPRYTVGTERALTDVSPSATLPRASEEGLVRVEAPKPAPAPERPPRRTNAFGALLLGVIIGFVFGYLAHR